jgi:hypothetical protein
VLILVLPSANNIRIVLLRAVTAFNSGYGSFDDQVFEQCCIVRVGILLTLAVLFAFLPLEGRTRRTAVTVDEVKFLLRELRSTSDLCPDTGSVCH